MIDWTCVQLCVLHTGALLLTGCQMVVIYCDWCGCLSGKDGARTLGGFAHGLCHDKTLVGKENLPRNPIKSAQQVSWDCHAPLDH